MKETRGVKSGLTIFFATTIIVAVLDQATKALVTSRLGLNSIHAIIPGVLNLVYFRNTGSAFGLFRGASSLKTVLMTLLTLAAIIALAFIIRRATSKLQALVLSLISGGALGNLIDRLARGAVVDFIDLHAGAYHWPAFNLADSAITTGVIASLIIMFVREENK
jgi:signal peptidase II